MGVGDKFNDLLLLLGQEEPKIHDIKVKVENNELHHILVSQGATVDDHNHSIKINFDSNDNNVTTKILVYPKTIQIDIGCTYKPLVYDVKTFFYLHEHLSKISYHLFTLSGVSLPPADEWIFTHYHMNKDGSVAWNGQSFHFTVEEVGSGMIRFYSKKMQDGTVIPRLEQIQTPQNSLDQEMKKAMEVKQN